MTSSAGVLALLAGALFVFVRVYPRFAEVFPKCVFHELTGLHCTGCGSTRSFFALLTGDLSGAWAQNPLLVVLLPWLGWTLLRRALQLLGARTGPSRSSQYDGRDGSESRFGIELPGKWHWLFAVLVVAFTVLRNVPGGEFLGPQE